MDVLRRDVYEIHKYIYLTRWEYGKIGWILFFNGTLVQYSIPKERYESEYRDKKRRRMAREEGREIERGKRQLLMKALRDWSPLSSYKFVPRLQAHFKTLVKHLWQRWFCKYGTWQSWKLRTFASRDEFIVCKVLSPHLSNHSNSFYAIPTQNELHTYV